MTIVAGQSLTRKLQVAISGHQGDIAEVATTSTAKVHLGKADNLLAALVISGAPVPTLLYLSRSGVHHTEGNVCTNKHMTVVACTDTGINVLCKIVSHCCHTQEQTDK